MLDPNRKRMLALDGGGIRGLISLGYLKAIENQLRQAYEKPDFLLRDYFDYIAGTSTGAIIAAGLSLGKSVDEVSSLYLDHGKKIFDKRSFLGRTASGFRHTYGHKALTNKLREEFGSESILELQQSGKLSRQKHLMIVTRNVNTDSPWTLSTNPSAQYNNTKRLDCNLRIPLWQLVRASTAAPTYFAPEFLQWDPSDPDKHFYFEDGGVTPYNNPAFQLFKMATLPQFGCNWEMGEDKLMLLSIGTGYKYRELSEPSSNGESLLTTAKTVPSELMRGIAVENDINCRAIGRCVFGHEIDREIGDLVVPAGTSPTSRAFTYARYNVDTSQESLEAMGLGDIDSGRFELDSIEASADLVRVGKMSADKSVDLASQFPGFL